MKTAIKTSKTNYGRRGGTAITIVNPGSIASIIRSLISPAPSDQPAMPLHITIETVWLQFH